MDRLQMMQTFVRVVEAGSFSAVAREQGNTQSAVSKQVAALERSIGARLLTRTTRSLALTDEGERYFEDVRRLLAALDEAESSARGASQRLRGGLRVAASVGFGRLVLLPVALRFLQQHPAVTIDLRLADGFVDLVEQGIDVSLRIGELADTSLVARRVGSTQLQVVAHRDWVRRTRRAGKGSPGLPREPEDLLRHNCIVYTELATRNEWRFVAGPGARVPAGTSQSVRVTGSLQTNSSEIVRATVLAGFALGYAPDWLFDDELRRGEVVTLLTEWVPPAIPMHLVSPPARRHSAKVRAFGDMMAEALSVRSAQPGRGTARERPARRR